MTGYAFTLAGTTLVALPSGALHWPAARLLCVSDLHLGTAQRQARFGGAALPPYETRETLARLDADLGVTGARAVICLGDSFDDAGAAARLDADDRQWLLRLMAGRDWTWIAGNHDPGPPGLPGVLRAALAAGPITFRHIARPGSAGEISGHFHPKARIAGAGGFARPCFLIDAARAILPAYGRYTGGLDASAAVLGGLMGPGALAVLTGDRTRAIPMPRAAPGMPQRRA
ncbi:MAG: ligase-associated DNA damage response endonuclease PdeM [Gemmobacter sp.]